MPNTPNENELERMGYAARDIKITIQQRKAMLDGATNDADRVTHKRLLAEHLDTEREITGNIERLHKLTTKEDAK